MAAPVNGLGAQQVPLSSPFQPGQSSNNQVKQDRDQNIIRTSQEDALKTDSSNRSNEQRRGSLLDITV